MTNTEKQTRRSAAIKDAQWRRYLLIKAAGKIELDAQVIARTEYRAYNARVDSVWGVGETACQRSFDRARAIFMIAHREANVLYNAELKAIYDLYR